MMIKFTKMHGLGNDFAIFDAVRQDINLNSDSVRFIANRKLGIGADQVIVLRKPSHAEDDFDYLIYNADGSEVGQCGNAARCVAKFISDQGLSKKQHHWLRTKTTRIGVECEEDGISVQMGVPCFNPAQIPIASGESKRQYALTIDGQRVEFYALSIGNPHAVILVDNVDKAPVNELGAIMTGHDFFPEKANIGFLQIQDRQRVRLRVFERGAGETLACGSGACAAVVAGIRDGMLDTSVCVELLGGTLMISWQGDHAQVMMKGAATKVFEGGIHLEKC